MVIKTKNIPLLGLKTIQELDLIKIDELKVNNSKEKFIKNNIEIFEGVGKFPYKYKIELKANVEPVINACRRVPDTVKQKLIQSLQELENKDIIEKVNESTATDNNIVIIEKPNGSLRICLDPLHLNKALKKEVYLIPTVEELGLITRDKEFFTVLDMKEGFYQIELGSECSKLCTFITPLGKYKFKRLPFGLSTSPEVFQKMNSEIFSDLNVGIYFDESQERQKMIMINYW